MAVVRIPDEKTSKRCGPLRSLQLDVKNATGSCARRCHATGPCARRCVAVSFILRVWDRGAIVVRCKRYSRVVPHCGHVSRQLFLAVRAYNVGQIAVASGPCRFSVARTDSVAFNQKKKWPANRELIQQHCVDCPVVCGSLRVSRGCRLETCSAVGRCPLRPRYAGGALGGSMLIFECPV